MRDCNNVLRAEHEEQLEKKIICESACPARHIQIYIYIHYKHYTRLHTQGYTQRPSRRIIISESCNL